MNEKQKQQEHFEKLIHKELPSQLPTHCVKKSYWRMLVHCITQDGVFACKKNGARVHARMTMRNVFDRTGQMTAFNIPVAVLYCSGCDLVPNTHGGDPIFEDELTTLSM